MSTTENGRDTPPVLPQHAVTHEVADRAARMFHPGGYEITGYVLTQKISSWKAVVDVTGVRWMSPADMTRLLGWKAPTGSGAPPDGSQTDDPEAFAALPVPAAIATPPKANKADLMRPASHGPMTDTDQAMKLLAERLGCGYNDTISHNTGWFVPGNQVAYSSALDAIEALVESLKQTANSYRPRADKSAATSPQPQRQDRSDSAQQNLL